MHSNILSNFAWVMPCMLQFSMKRLPLNQFLSVTILVVENSLLTFPGCKTFNGKQIDLGLKMSTVLCFGGGSIAISELSSQLHLQSSLFLQALISPLAD